MVIDQPVTVIVETIIADLLITAYRAPLINNAVTVIVFAITELIAAVATAFIIDPITVVVDPIADLGLRVTARRTDLVDLTITVIVNPIALLRTVSAHTRTCRVCEDITGATPVVVTVIVCVTRGACDEAHSSTATIAVTPRRWITEIIIIAAAVSIKETLSKTALISTP